uniref:Uncharacterized protein n=1 Tax=Anguilla anguilla TaxID=7936 RepID=A0A0E9TCX3_ANGAN
MLSQQTKGDQGHSGKIYLFQDARGNSLSFPPPDVGYFKR